MKESDIRPADIMKEFIGLCARDAETYFVGIPREKIPCPACDSRAAQLIVPSLTTLRMPVPALAEASTTAKKISQNHLPYILLHS